MNRAHCMRGCGSLHVLSNGPSRAHVFLSARMFLMAEECELCGGLQRVQQGMHDVEVEKVQRQCSFDILSILGDLGWSLMDSDTLPFGIALPIHEALHLLRKDPPSGTPLAYCQQP